METWHIILIAGLLSFPILSLIFGVIFTYRRNKDEFNSDQKKLQQEEIAKAIPYDSVEEANNEVISASKKPALIYGLYFMITIPVIVNYFGRVHYGPNLPYTVFLLAVGIPFLACFCHMLMKVENRRYRVAASNINYKSKSISVVEWIAIIPALYILLIMGLLKISNLLFAH